MNGSKVYSYSATLCLQRKIIFVYQEICLQENCKDIKCTCLLSCFCLLNNYVDVTSTSLIRALGVNGP